MESRSEGWFFLCVLLLLMTRLSFRAARQCMFAGSGVGSRRAPPTSPRCHVAPPSVASSFTLEWHSSVPITPFSCVCVCVCVCYCCVYSQQDWRARPSHTLAAAAAAAAAFRAATDSRFPALLLLLLSTLGFIYPPSTPLETLFSLIFYIRTG